MQTLNNVATKFGMCYYLQLLSAYVIACLLKGSRSWAIASVRRQLVNCGWLS